MVYPAEAFDPLATLQAVAEELQPSLWRPDHVIGSSSTIRSSEVRPEEPAHRRHHGGLAPPIEVMKRVQSQMNDMSQRVTIACGMTRRPRRCRPSARPTIRSSARVSTVGQDACRVEIKIGRCREGKGVPRGETGEFCTRWLLGDEGSGTTPRRPADAIDEAGWMRTGDLCDGLDEQGYVNIVEPAEGHGDPAARERLSASARLESPSTAPGDSGRRVDRRARPGAAAE